LGNVALLPALVNAHTHLEFSLFEKPFGQAGESFARWLKQMVAWRREQPAVQGQEELALEQGLRECKAAGVGVLGEIATPLFADAWNRRQPAYSQQQSATPHVRFLELLSLNPERMPMLATLADEYCQRTAAACTLGLSPHAPYTVHPELLSRTVRLSAQCKVPLAMHLAESREELELLATQTGELVELLQSLTAWYPDALPLNLRPLDYLRTLAQAHRALIAHGNYLSPEEIEFAAQHRERLSVVYCPRTHAWFDHDPYPLAAMLRAGVRMAVGTDSRASNPDLSLGKELQFIHQRHPSVDSAEILKMGTLNGAEALGISQDYGSLTPGKTGRLAAVELPAENDSPYEVLMTSISTCQSLEKFIQRGSAPSASAENAPR